MHLFSRTLTRLLLLSAFGLASAGQPAAPTASSASTTRPPGLPILVPMRAHALTDPRAALRLVGDADVLPDGRLAVLDAIGGRVALFDTGGRLLRLLDPPIGFDPQRLLMRRLVALPDGGLVVAEDRDHKFIFYDNRLRPQSVVSFGIETFNLSGFLRHPSGDLYLVAFCRQKQGILHRFDAAGNYLGSSVEALPFPSHAEVFNTGSAVVDPLDGTLWVTRLVPYEILHVNSQGVRLGRIARDLPGFSPSVQADSPGVVKFTANFSRSVGIAIIGGLVVNSYVLANGDRRADVFRRDGTVLATDLSSDDPLTFGKRVDQALILRFHSTGEPRIEIWREN